MEELKTEYYEPNKKKSECNYKNGSLNLYKFI